LKYDIGKPFKKNMQDHKVFDIKHFSKESFLNDIMKYDLLTNVSFDDNMIIEKWSKFKDMFIKKSEKHAPVKTQRLKNRNNTWIDHEITKLMYRRDYFKQLSVKNKCKDAKNKYRILKNEVSNKTIQAKAVYNKKVADECLDDPKKLWKFLNKVVQTKDHSNPPPEISANDFNDYFSSLGKDTAATLPKTKGDIPWKGPKSEKNILFYRRCRVRC
jgi:hypothetical protein